MATAEKAALPPDPLLRSTEDDAATIQASDNEKTTDKKEVAIALGAPESPKGAKGKKEDEGKEKGGYRSYLKLWSYAQPFDIFLRACGFIAACAAGSVLPLMTLVFGDLVNAFNAWGTGSISPADLRSAVNRNSLWFVYLFIGKFCLVYIHTVSFTLTATRATRAIRYAYIQSLLRQDISYFDTCTPGSVATSISNNADMIQSGLSEKVGSATQGVAMLTAAFVVAFSQGWKLTLVVATTLPATVLAIGITVALDAKLEAKILAIYAKAGGLVEESLGSIRNVTAMGAAPKLRAKYDKYLDEAMAFGIRKGPILGIQYSTEFFTMYASYSLAFYYGITLLLRGEFPSGGKVITVLFSVVIGTSSMTMIAPSIGEFSKAAAAAKAVLDMIAQQPTIDPVSDQGEAPETIVGNIQFRNVGFAYPARPTIKVLHDISLDFEARKTTAIVGASGSGKSTVVALTERWYDPLEGNILFDGRNIRDLNVRWLRTQIGLVQQEPVLFNDTIYNNVVHGLFGTEMDDYSEEKKRELVRQACVEANADGFIQNLPERYDTVVGEKGGFISGGQKQRVAIARSIISNPRILLLDEATSALDPKAEGIVQAALDRVSQSRTTIMIAHKLSTVKKADKIIVMNEGRVIETGTHESLLDAEGAYYRLVQAQNLGTDSKESYATKASSEASQDDEDLALTKTKTTNSLGPFKSALKEEDFSRKWSLAYCLVVIIRENRRYWPYFVGAFIASCAGGGAFPAQAVVFSRAVTVFQYSGSTLRSKGNFWALIFFVLALGVLVSYALIGFCCTTSAFKVTRGYRSQYFNAMLTQDIGFFDIEGHSSGALTSKLSTDPQRLMELISGNIGLILIVIVNLISSCALALAYGWKLSLVAIFGCIPALFFAGFMRMRLEIQSQDRSAKMYQESARFAAEAAGAIRTVSSLTLERKVLQSYGDRLDTVARKAYKHILRTMILFGLSESLDLVAMGLAFWYGGKLLSQGEYTTQDFFVIFVAIIFGGQAAGFLFGYTLNTTKAHGAANNIIHLRNASPPINTSTGRPLDDSDEREEDCAIELDNVRFSYPTRPSIGVLRGLSMRIPHGSSVGVVGASGCGKTTVIGLLERFYDIDGGSIKISGQELRDLDVHTYRSTVGLVSQDTTLYQGSLRDNVLLGVPEGQEVSEERLHAACRAANIHDFIFSLPEGYNTDAGSRGLALSGGQRQRIAIARALIRDPKILLLDEATSALDTQSEEVVQKALETAAKGRTTVAVAHRLSTVRSCDRIFVLERGKVVETGTHKELVALKGKYYEMVLAQSLDRKAE